MSWKSFVTAGLLCVLATPAFADPTVQAVAGGSVAGNNLNASGNWVWVINITPDYGLVPDASGTPIAAELGFTSGATGGGSATVSSATRGSGFDTDNPGNVIFGWETLTNLGGTGACNSGNPGNCPVGIQIGGTNNTQVFSALGSPNHTSGAQQYLVMTTGRPVTPNAATLATTTITMSGAYSGNGRIAQINGGTAPNYTSGNFSTFSGTVTRQAKGGDTNLDGTISAADYSTLLANFNINDNARRWHHADFNGDNDVSAADYSMLLANFGAANNYTVYSDSTFGAGGGSGGAVPEPTSVALCGLALLAGLGFTRRR